MLTLTFAALWIALGVAMLIPYPTVRRVYGACTVVLFVATFLAHL